MHRRIIYTATALLALVVLLPQPDLACAQDQDATKPIPGKTYRSMEFNGGDLNNRVKGYAVVHGPFIPRVVMVSPQGFSGQLYLETVFEEEGWMHAFAERGWNAFSIDLVGSGNSQPPFSKDLVDQIEHSIYGMYNFAMAITPTSWIGQGIGAAFIIKLRSTTPDKVPCAILIDPMGPKGTQPLTDATVADLVERRDQLDDLLWVDWGIGAEPGEVYADSDLGAEGYELLIDRYRRDEPRYAVAAQSGLHHWLRVDNPRNIDGFPVIVARSPNVTEEEIARQDAVITWLQQNGAQVDLRNLADLQLPGLSNLPMAGHHAPAVGGTLYDWIQEFPSVQAFDESETRDRTLETNPEFEKNRP